jgi:hypothetical protein
MYVCTETIPDLGRRTRNLRPVEYTHTNIAGRDLARHKQNISVTQRFTLEMTSGMGEVHNPPNRLRPVRYKGHTCGGICMYV